MISVCIPTYNQASYLRQSVALALRQTMPPQAILISDDASTDDTPLVGRELAEKHSIVRYIRQERNLGIGGNSDWLMRRPQTEFVARLDSDDFYEPAYLACLEALLRKHPRAAYAHAAVNEVDEHSRVLRVRRLAPRSEYIGPEDSLRALSQGYRVCANILLFRREALDSVGFGKTDMAFAEDWDLAVRLADAGWGNCHCPEVLANYRVWSDAGGYRRSRKLSEVRGIRRVFEESLQPAYAKRGWDCAPLAKLRTRFAAAQAHVLLDGEVAEDAKAELISELNALGAGPRLQYVLWLARHKRLARMHRFWRRFEQGAKDRVKSMLART